MDEGLYNLGLINRLEGRTFREALVRHLVGSSVLFVKKVSIEFSVRWGGFFDIAHSLVLKLLGLEKNKLLHVLEKLHKRSLKLPPTATSKGHLVFDTVVPLWGVVGARA